MKSETRVWQICVRYKDRGIWRTYRTDRAYETRRAALDRATDLQHHPIRGNVPERWFAKPVMLTTAQEVQS